MKYHRWNFEATDSGIVVCKNEHEKGHPCEYEELTPKEAIKIIEEMASLLSRTECLFQQIELAKLNFKIS